jgi:hypothetical protein
MVGLNRHNDGNQVINSWLGRNCIKKTLMFLEIGYRVGYKDYI